MPSSLLPSVELLDDFGARLRPRLQGTLYTDAMTRALYATDASLYKMNPVGVLIPRHADDVQAAMEEAARLNIPILARGGGSSLSGQAIGAALVIDFTKHLDGVLELNAEEGWVRVQPGITLAALDRVLRAEAPGWMVGPDPSSGNRATLGGMAATNATGTHSILYGNIIHHIREIEVLLADGSTATFAPVDANGWTARKKMDGLEGAIYRSLDKLLHDKGDVIRRDTPKHWRRNSGYRLEHLLLNEKIIGFEGLRAVAGNGTRNIAQVLCGSEGTLAVTTALELNLVRRPARTILAIVHFRTRDEALRSVTRILQTKPSAIELFDGVAIDQTRRAPGFAHRLGFIEGEPGGVLIVEYTSDNADVKADTELRSCVGRLKEVLAKAGQGYAVVPIADAEGMANVWYVRKEGLGLIMGVKGDYKPVAVIEDASVPVEHLADYIEDLDEMMQALDTKTVYYAHASAGTLHVRPFLNTKDAAGVEKLREISVGSMELVKKYGGAVSSEHGDGIVRGWLNEQFLGPELCDVYRRLKGIFDPNGLLNPGKILDTPPMTESLRFDPAYETIPVLEEMDWSADGGFARSVELCNGNGACRQLQSGTMCPSFMVTRDERDSTRGRANALRAALSGELPPEAFTGKDLYDVMDLCVQCKGCKTECPSNVDMAKMKTEWLSKYWEANSLPRRTRLFARQPVLARRLNGGFLARVANWGSSLRFVQKRLGISTRRTPPPFAAEPFTKWFARQNWESDGPEVVLFADTFSNYNHPEVARAAAEFLHRTGHQVIVPSAEACCGRPLLSKGLVAEAQEMALKTLALLLPYAEKGWPIVGLEPSCILTFGDEFLSLLPGDPHARTLADASMTFEEFVERRAGEGAFEEIRWKEQPKQVLLHGHCHQKALVGTGFAERSLALPGHSVTTVDSGCCGMAGAFGYEAEHYDVSIKMAERVLAPAVRNAAEDTIIAAAGTSCREQIKDTTGRRALHPAEILRDALADE